MTALEMDPAIRARWVAALRSGEYAQGHTYLRRGDKLCCLGVLCELAVQDSVIPAARPGRGSAWLYARCGGRLPFAVMEWAGLASSDPDVSGVCLSDLNDGVTEEDAEDGPAIAPRTFAEIADLIEGVAPQPGEPS